MTSFAKYLEQHVCENKCVGFRRILNSNAKDPIKIHNYVLADVAMEHMADTKAVLLKKLKLSKLDACMFLETKGMVDLPRMIHYMDKHSCETHCDKALNKCLLERIWPNL